MIRNLIDQLTRKRLGPRRQRHRQSRRTTFHRALSRGLQVEPLEDRRLLAVISAVEDGVADVFTVRANVATGSVEVFVNGILAGTDPTVVNGSADDDTLIIDGSNGLPDVDIQYHGFGGNDLLELVSVAAADATYVTAPATTTDGFDGVTTFDDGVHVSRVAFTGLEPMTFVGAGGSLTIDATFSPATDTLTIADSGGPADGVNIVSGNGGFEETTFSGFDSLTLRGGDGAETITIASLDGAATTTGTALSAITLSGDNTTGTDVSADRFQIDVLPSTVAVTVEGGDGDDKLTVNGAPGAVTGDITFDGGANSGIGDTLRYVGQGANNVTGVGVGNITGGDRPVHYLGVERVAIGRDSVNVSLAQAVIENITLVLENATTTKLFDTDDPTDPTTTFLLSNVTELIIQGSANDNRLTIDYSNGDPLSIIPAGVYFIGDAGIDSLAVSGNGNTAIYQPGAPGAGVVSVDGQLIEFTGLEPVDITGMAMATLALPERDDVLNVTNGMTALGLPAIVVSGTTAGRPFEQVAFRNNAQVIVDTAAGGGVGDDRVTVASADNAHNNANLTILTGQGADLVDVNGNVVLAGSGSNLRVQTQDITLGGQITVTGLVDLDAGAGSMVDDLTGEAANIISMTAALRAGTGIGNTDDIDTAISTLVASNTTTGDIQISNVAGGLIIGAAAGLAGISNAAPGGAAIIRNANSLTVASNVTASGAITLTATDADAAPSSEDLIVSNGATVQSTGGNVTLRGGDDVSIDSGATIKAADTVRIEGDFGDLDAGRGSVIDISGAIITVNRAIVLGEADNDSITLAPAAGSSGAILLDAQGGIDDYLVQLGNLGGQVDVDDQAGEGRDDLTINGTDIAETFTVGATSTSSGTETVTYTSGLEFLAVQTLGGADTIDITPSPDLEIDIFGGLPTAAQGAPRDTVNFMTPASHSTTLSNLGPDSGRIAAVGAGNFLGVTFDAIEEVRIAGAITVDGGGLDDVLEITATSETAGSFVLTTNLVPGPRVSFSGNRSFTFNASDGNDQLIINHPSDTLFAPMGGVFYNGQGGAGDTDNLTLVGGIASSTTYHFTNLNDGFVDYNGTRAITYTGLEPITSTITATDVTLNYSTATETITVTGDPVGGNTKVNSTSGESVTFANPTGTLTVNAGDMGDDTINIDRLSVDYPANIVIDGQGSSGNDIVNINGTVSLIADKSLTVTADTINLPTDMSFVSTGGTGTVSLTADRNIAMSFGSMITTVAGAITLLAYQGPAPASGNFAGIELSNATVSSTTGNVTLAGRGGEMGFGNHGVRVDGGAMVSGGDIEITGTEGGDPSGLGILISAAAVETNGTGNITLVANSTDLGNGTKVNAGSNTVTVRQLTNGVAFDLGAAVDPIAGPLGLSDAELDRIMAGRLTVGHSNSGDVTVSSEASPANVTTFEIISGGAIGDSNTTATDLAAPNVILDGNVSPGIPPSPGTIGVSGNFAFADGDMFSVEIGGTTPGAGAGFHDQLDVAGGIVIGNNVTLVTSPFDDGTGVNFVFAVGDQFVIINNDGTDAVTGTFAGLPEGTQFLLAGTNQVFAISYRGGAQANDVVLTYSGAIEVEIVTTANVTENGMAQDIQLMLSTPVPLPSQVDVRVTSSNISADDNDYDSGSFPKTVSFAAGSTNGAIANVQITPTADNVVEADEALRLDLLLTAGTAAVGPNGSSIVTIVNNDAATLTIDSPTVTEGTGAGTTTLTFTVTSSAAVQGGFTVAFSNTAGTADASDYTVTTVSPLTFTGSAGETQTISVDIARDAIVEADEQFTVTLGAVAATTVVQAAVITTGAVGIGTITDDDASVLMIDSPTVTEGTGVGTTTLTFTVTSSAAVQGGFTVAFSNTAGTADASDYTVTTVSPLTFTGSAGETQTISVDIARDAVVEADEQFTVTLGAVAATTAVQAAVITTGAVGTGTITDDDASVLMIDSPTVTEGTGAGTTTLTFTVTSSAAVQGGFTVAFSDTAGTADASDYTVTTVSPLTFTGSAGETQTISVDIARDAIVEADEQFTVTLGAVAATTVVQAAVITTGTVGIGTITDDDSATLTLSSVSATNLEGDSGTMAFTFQVLLSNAVQGGLTLAYTTNDGTATKADLDYVDNDDTLPFMGTAGETKTITVLVNGDTKVEADETFTVALGAIRGLAAGVPGGAGTITTVGSPATGAIVNDDSATFMIDDVTVNEAAGTLTFTVRADKALDIVIDAEVSYADMSATGGGADYDSAADTVTFAAGETVKTVTVAITNDMLVEATETFVASLSTSTALGGRSVDLTDKGTGTITDDDLLFVEFSPSMGMGVESSGGNLPQLLVTGQIQAGHSVTIDTAVAASSTATPGVDFNVPTTVVVGGGTYNATAVAITGLSIVDDALIESDETIDLGTLTGSQILVSDANADGTIQAATQYTVIDDEMPTTAVRPGDPSVLTIRDVVPGGKTDQLELTIVGDRLVIRDPNNLVGDYTDNTTGSKVDVPLASISSIEIDLAEGDDQFIIDFSNAPPNFNMSVTVRGGGGNDVVTFLGSNPLGSGNLTANNGIEHILVNGSISTSGEFHLAAGRDVFGNCSLITGATGAIDGLTGIGGIRVATTGAVTITSNGGGIAGCGTNTVVAARTATLIAKTGIGTAIVRNGQATLIDPLRTQLERLTAKADGVGIFIRNEGPLTILSADTTQPFPYGIIDIQASSGGAPAGDLEGEASPWQNALNHLDVNQDAHVSALDALIVINVLNAGGTLMASGESVSTAYVDVNGDWAVTPLDALMIINSLNSRTAADAEGESTGSGHDRVPNIHVEQLFAHDLSLASTVLGGRSRQPDSDGVSLSRRSGEFSVRPPISPASFGRPTPLTRAMQASDEASCKWEALLDEIAKETAEAWLANL